MATDVLFFVEGTPKAQPRLRPRMGRDGRLSVHMPSSAEGWRLAVLLAARAAMSEPLVGPLAVSMTFWLDPPKSRPARVHPVAKPDLDNLAKSTADALNGIAWKDDSAIVQWALEKRYTSHGIRPGVVIQIEVLQ